MLNIIFAVVGLFFLFKFSGPILQLLNQVFGMASKTIAVGEVHLDSWAEDAQLSAKINSERKKAQLKAELEKVNAVREKDGKAPLEMPE